VAAAIGEVVPPWVQGSFIKVQDRRVRVRLSGEGGRRRRYRFNASISAREGRRRDELLSEGEAEAVSSSWLHGKEV
jgi:hypothetical protein